MVKRFNVVSITRDKQYPITKGTAGSKLLYFTMNPNGEAEVVNVQLKPVPGIRKYGFDFDFKKMAIKGRVSVGNILSKYPVKKIVLKEAGVSTLAARKIWFDDTVRRLNTEERGQFLGEFKAEDKILCVNQMGDYKLLNYSLSNHFEEDMVLLEKFNPKKPLSTVYWDGDKKQYNVKRFLIEDAGKSISFITEHEDSYLEVVSTDWRPVLQLVYSKVKGKEKDSETKVAEELIGVKGYKAIGNKLSKDKIKMINLLDPLVYEVEEDESQQNTDDESDANDEPQGTIDFDSNED